MKIIYSVVLFVLLVGAGTAMHNNGDEDLDSIVVWNTLYVNISSTGVHIGFFVEGRELAMLDLACHDAINSIQLEYELYGLRIFATPAASLSAAISAAFYTLFSRFVDTRLNANSTVLFWNSTERAELHQRIDDTYTTLLAKIPDSSRKLAGIRVGVAAAEAMWESRLDDGWNLTASYPLGAQPAGVWYPPDNMSMPPYWHYKDVRLFTRKPFSFFRSSPAPSITDRAYVENLAITRIYGNLTSSVRTEAQTQNGLFWSRTAGTTIGTKILNQLLLNNSQYSLHEKTRLYALVALAGADSISSNLENKNTFRFWRPFQAIQNGGGAVNPDLVAEPSWTPLVPTPGNPEYPAGHPMQTAASIHALRLAYGDIPRMTLLDRLGTPMEFYSLDDIQYSVNIGRVYGGMHLLLSGEVGQRIGESIALYSVNNFLRPKWMGL